MINDSEIFPFSVLSNYMPHVGCLLGIDRQLNQSFSHTAYRQCYQQYDQANSHMSRQVTGGFHVSSPTN